MGYIRPQWKHHQWPCRLPMKTHAKKNAGENFWPIMCFLFFRFFDLQCTILGVLKQSLDTITMFTTNLIIISSEIVTTLPWLASATASVRNTTTAALTTTSFVQVLLLATIRTIITTKTYQPATPPHQLLKHLAALLLSRTLLSVFRSVFCIWKLVYLALNCN